MARIRNNNFVQLKRFFRDNNIPYYINAPYLVVPPCYDKKVEAEWPGTMFRFENDFPNRVSVLKCPFEDCMEYSFEAPGLYTILQHLIRFKLIRGDKVNKLKVRGMNYFPGQAVDPRMKVSKRRKSA